MKIRVRNSRNPKLTALLVFVVVAVLDILVIRQSFPWPHILLFHPYFKFFNLILRPYSPAVFVTARE